MVALAPAAPRRPAVGALLASSAGGSREGLAGVGVVVADNAPAPLPTVSVDFDVGTMAG